MGEGAGGLVVAVGTGVLVGGCGVQVAVRVRGSGDGVTASVSGSCDGILKGIGVSVGGTGVSVPVGNGENVSAGLREAGAVIAAAGDGETPLPTAWVGSGEIGGGTCVGEVWQLAMRRVVSTKPRHR